MKLSENIGVDQLLVGNVGGNSFNETLMERLVGKVNLWNFVLKDGEVLDQQEVFDIRSVENNVAICCQFRGSFGGVKVM